MEVTILRESEEAQLFLLQSLCLQRATAPTGVTVKPTLEWALEIAGGGHPLPPLGIVADFGHVALGIERETKLRVDAPALPGMPPALMRTYEDYLLGKLYSDRHFERASDALRRFQGRDRAKGLSYIIRQFRERLGLGGIELSPGVIRSLSELTADEVLRRGWEAISSRGLMPLIVTQYETYTRAARRMAEVLGLEDIIALEQRTALADMGQYVAHRQVLQVAARLEAALPHHRIKPLANRQEVPTRVLNEDMYPVGGFSSISNRGSIESLLHSQLAYIEPDPSERPDLFDVKFLRDELYYYARDENQFLRRRCSFLIALHADLVKARFQDSNLPVQRIVMVLGMIVALVRKMADWLSADALHFEFLVVPAGDSQPLTHEVELLEMLFREQIENDTVAIREFRDPLGPYAERISQRSMCHLLWISTETETILCERAVVTGLKIDGPRPELHAGRGEPILFEDDDPLDAWIATLINLLGRWV